MVKFSNCVDYEFALTGGPWLMYDHYLTIRKWDPDFDPEKTEIEKVVVWVRLPGLSIRLYDEKFLTFVGNRIGRTLKVDATIVDQSRGKYARLCVEIELKKELLSEYSIKGKTYRIEYESLHMICFFYGKYKHYINEGVEKAKASQIKSIEEKEKEILGLRVRLEQNLVYEEWMVA